MTEPSPARPRFPLTLSDGERGHAAGYADGMLHVVCERAHPPGQPLSLILVAPGGEELALSGKSARSKRREDGTFDLQLKLVSLRRDQRIVLEAYYRVPNRE